MGAKAIKLVGIYLRNPSSMQDVCPMNPSMQFNGLSSHESPVVGGEQGGGSPGE